MYVTEKKQPYDYNINLHFKLMQKNNNNNKKNPQLSSPSRKKEEYVL